MLLSLAALAFLLTACAIGITHVVIQAKSTSRAARSLAGSLAAETEALAPRVARTEEAAARAQAGLEQLELALTRLSRSMAKLRILRRALRDVEHAILLVRALRAL